MGLSPDSSYTFPMIFTVSFWAMSTSTLKNNNAIKRKEKRCRVIMIQFSLCTSKFRIFHHPKLVFSVNDRGCPVNDSYT
ncbi:hypothetical protein [Arenibacter aquaticus]|uniref:hypothetical protein n=1 Tax=Arenibacter aquaticus TaxID=2489054 RepID=UPI003742C544